MEPLVVAAALAGGAGLAGVAIFAAWKTTRRPRESETVEMHLVDESPVRFVPPANAPAARVVQAPAAPPPPPTSPRSHAERAPAMLLTHGVQMQDDTFSRRAPPRPAERPPFREPPPMKTWAQQALAESGPEVSTEWARRQVGPVEPGRVAGACGGCGARLSVSTERPLRIACPVCGRTKLLA